jgi:hypothetical protein
MRERKPPMFEELTGILMQEEERWMTLKPQSSDLALMAKKKPFRGRPNAGQKGGGTPQRESPHLKVCLQTESDSGPNVFIVVELVI